MFNDHNLKKKSIQFVFLKKYIEKKTRINSELPTI